MTQHRLMHKGLYAKISSPALLHDIVKFQKKVEKHKLRLDTTILWIDIKLLSSRIIKNTSNYTTTLILEWLSHVSVQCALH